MSSSYRTIEFAWQPRTRAGWRTFTLARLEAGRLWADLVVRHHRIRCLQWRWPTKQRWQRWARGRYPNLHSQSVQQIIADFCEAVEATRQLRLNAHAEACYPRRKPRYKGVIYTNQAATITNGWLRLPNGKSGSLRIRIPSNISLPGRLVEVRLDYGRIMLVCQVADQPATVAATITIGIDLGVNTLLAATDGRQALLISGRAAKATVQWRNKQLATIQSRLAGLTKRSRLQRRLQRRKYQMLAKAERRMNDIIHKATRQVATAFPNARCFVGEPFNDAAQHCGRVQAQQVSSASGAQIMRMLGYKTAGVTAVNEAYSSQTCPNCGRRRKCRRSYRCQECGITAPRDVIGATNILAIGRNGSLQTGCVVPTRVQFVHPSKYPGRSQVVPGDTRHVAPYSCGEATPIYGL
jgi:putative transposase